MRQGARGGTRARAERFVAKGKNEESNGIVKVGRRYLRAAENAQKNAVALGKGYRKQATTKKLSSLTKEHRQPGRLMLQLF